jgi:hypothetical protein
MGITIPSIAMDSVAIDILIASLRYNQDTQKVVADGCGCTGDAQSFIAESLSWTGDPLSFASDA